MRRLRFSAALIVGTFLATVVAVRHLPLALQAQDPPPERTKPVPELSAREQKLVALLESSVLSGKWRLVEAGKLGAESSDTYTIHSIEKVKGNAWVVKARIKYGDKDLTLPVPVDVHWAGDTPVLSVTDRGLPGLGTYTARVLFHDGLYAGTWSGPGHAGFLSGVIQKAPPLAGQPASESK